MFYGLFELLAYSILEFQRLSAAFPLWLIAALVGTALFGGAFLAVGRAVYRGWRPPWVLGAVAGLALPLTFLAILLLFSSSYIRPAIIAIIGGWQQSFLQDEPWSNETFRLQYQAVSALRHADGTPIEDLAGHPSPDAGGTLIPVTTPQAKAVVADIDSRRVAEHVQHDIPFLARLLWTKDRPLPEALRQDMERFFADNPKVAYDHGRAVQLAADEMQSLLAAKVGRIVLTVRLAIGTTLTALWLPLLAFAIYNAWKKLEPSTGRQ